MTGEAHIEAAGEGRYLLCGELSFATVPALLREVDTPFNGQEQVILDLERVTRADSAGLALLVEWVRRARQRSTPLTIRNMPPQLQGMAKVAGLDRVLSLNGN
ncbi:MAG TPA: STAS domain-containing protein [Gammaproteobacteria bacterium]|nr:STAS domain-containing protein [Gammaproteobacteria bacterium]